MRVKVVPPDCDHDQVHDKIAAIVADPGRTVSNPTNSVSLRSPTATTQYCDDVTVANIVLDFVKTLVWPVLIGCLAIGYRRSIQRLLTRLTKVDAPGVSATFEAAAKDAAAISGTSTGTAAHTVNLATVHRVVLHNYKELRKVGESFRSGKAVIVDLTQTSNTDAKRMVDFSAGLTFQAKGTMDKVANKVFLLTHGDPTPDKDK
jgi:hypothetical protein